MIPWARNVGAWQMAALAAALVLGIWAGAHMHYSHMAKTTVGKAQTVTRVPVGEASEPSANDLGPALDAGVIEAAKVPARIPDFTLSDRAGKATSIATWAGKSLILNFWATWCAPCRREIPLLKSLSNQWSGRGMQVVGVAVDYRDKVNTYADELKITYPLLVGEQEALDVAARLGVDSPVFPFTVFTDRRGEVVALYVGELHKPQADLILGVVQSLNDDRLPLQEARRNIADGLHALATS